MPIVNADSALVERGHGRERFRSQADRPIESGKEVVRMAGQNSSSPANSFESRITQEVGTQLT